MGQPYAYALGTTTSWLCATCAAVCPPNASPAQADDWLHDHLNAHKTHQVLERQLAQYAWKRRN